MMRAPREEYAAAVEKLRQTSKYYAQATVDVSRLPDGEESHVFEGCVLETAADSCLARELLQNEILAEPFGNGWRLGASGSRRRS